jgi:hypothetical protein
VFFVAKPQVYLPDRTVPLLECSEQKGWQGASTLIVPGSALSFVLETASNYNLQRNAEAGQIAADMFGFRVQVTPFTAADGEAADEAGSKEQISCSRTVLRHLTRLGACCAQFSTVFPGARGSDDTAEKSLSRAAATAAAAKDVAAKAAAAAPAAGSGPKNRAGCAMKPGSGNALYCGRRLGVAAIPGSDGQCGPNNGPQCADCKVGQRQLRYIYSLMSFLPGWAGCAEGR